MANEPFVLIQPQIRVSQMPRLMCVTESEHIVSPSAWPMIRVVTLSHISVVVVLKISGTLQVGVITTEPPISQRFRAPAYHLMLTRTQARSLLQTMLSPYAHKVTSPSIIPWMNPTELLLTLSRIVFAAAISAQARAIQHPGNLLFHLLQP